MAYTHAVLTFHWPHLTSMQCLFFHRPRFTPSQYFFSIGYSLHPCIPCFQWSFCSFYLWPDVSVNNICWFPCRSRWYITIKQKNLTKKRKKKERNFFLYWERVKIHFALRFYCAFKDLLMGCEGLPFLSLCSGWSTFSFLICLSVNFRY